MKLNWLKRSIRTKLIVFLLLAIGLPMLASILATNARTERIVSDEAVRQASNLIYQGKTNLNNYFDMAYGTTLLPYNDTQFGDTLYKILEQGRDDYLSEQVVNRSLLSIGNSMKEIYQVYLHAAAAEKGYLVVKGNLKKAHQLEPYGSAIPETEMTKIDPAHQSHLYGMQTLPYYAPKPVITIHRKIVQVPSFKPIGTLAIDLTTEVIDDICRNLYDPGLEELYLLTEDGTIVYGPDERKRGKRLNEAWVREALAGGQTRGHQSYKEEGHSGIYVYERLTDNGMNWTLIKRIPDKLLQAGTRQVTAVNTFVLGCSLIVAAAAAIFVSFWITSPLKKLTGYVNRIQSGELETDIRLTREDEIGILARRFRLMMETINNLVLREYRLELASKTNQLKALQAQVQPHFIYNALQSIGTAALQSGARDVYHLVMLLGKMMRYSMNTSESIVQLSQEIEHTQAYLELQKRRFGDKLAYEISMAPDTAALAVPRMVLQPLVENVFKHAFDPVGGQIRVWISTFRQGRHAAIQVEDDGPGIPEAKLQELRTLLDEIGKPEEQSLPSRREDGHIGLYNVMSRLRLHAGPDAAMKLESRPGRGLRITLLVPQHNGGGEPA
ncbi:integral membrane sensor signal transduction histidine kinase [Paenibacillus sp. 32O-W]|uniref:cache domain-containing sensor histidine kinase n=1 Tax=Paenibacillus sp. 32O-W TaxID=1695218 RepID=UPI000721F9DD|nr:sensor histidine kinase [Paenibacillus sp. 32O-W]ALS26829.1 integral membrane sensor signal transduction histidine kinase [Paenibacillus sp. 32O-W]